jgi:crotonobetainyl-CoA:carnitine CoA-transferase CaiB-like acyl-CoA transferase
VKNRQDLKVAIENKTQSKPIQHWVGALRDANIPCSPIQTVDQLCSDPQVDALQMIVPMSLAGAANYRTIDIPISLDGERAVKNAAPPALGQHTDEILHAAGFSDDEIGAFRADKTIA